MIQAERILNRLVEREDLTTEESREFLLAVMEGELSPAQIGAILTAFRMKGESVAEITGLIQAMRERMVRIEASDALDIVGTGGDSSGTFNISTASAFVAAGAGAKVAKHGNRAASSKCGSADVLEALGVCISLSPKDAEEVYKRAGMVFLFAPLYHPATKHVVAVRRELKIRTIFNVLGPFSNPAGAKRELIGVPNERIGKRMAEVAKQLGYAHLLIVASDDGMDEISSSGKTRCFELRGKMLKRSVIDPSKFGFKKAAKEKLQGGSAEENARIIRDILNGQKGPKRDIVVLNTAFALFVAGIAKEPHEGIKLAEVSIDSGSARKALEALIRESNAFGKTA